MVSNYDITAARAAGAFLQYDVAQMAEKFLLPLDAAYLYISFLSAPCRISRKTGMVERLDGDAPTPVSFDVCMTIYDVLCDSAPDCHLSGRFCRVNSLPGVAQTSGLGDRLFDDSAARFDHDPDALACACASVGGVPLSGADVAYQLPLFDFFPVQLRFWCSDEEFPANLRLLWDENTLQFMRYETTYYAADHLLHTLCAAMP